MKKDELVHVHSLLSVLASDLERRGAVESATLADYEALDVSPMAVYASKADHEEAVLTLSRALADACAGDADDRDLTVPSQ